MSKMKFDWGPIILAVVFTCGYATGWVSNEERHDRLIDESITFGAVIFESKLTDDMLADKEEVSCEFDEPITVVVSVLHYYDSYEDLQQAYLTEGWGTEEVWGWSDCEWQSENNYSACDIHTVHPEFVVADMAMDTLGHEVYHGSCGDFHD